MLLKYKSFFSPLETIINYFFTQIFDEQVYNQLNKLIIN
jgi:hypothetical protein